MATASVTNTFVNAAASSAAAMNTNFADLVTFLNGSVIHVDGSKAMTGALDAGGFRVKNVASPTTTGDAAIWGQVALSDMVSTGALTIPTTGVTVATLSITMPAAGMGIIFFAGNVSSTGVTYSSSAQINWTFSGTSYVALNTNVPILYANSTNYPIPGYGMTVPLAAGLNTITVTGTRQNNGSTSGGTITTNSDFKVGIVGLN